MLNLNFKHGLLEGLKNVAVENGTIYFVTDEKALYADFNNERIRIGQIVTTTSDKWDDTVVPYSTEAFYYITDTNSLMKYNATTAKWVKINDVSDLEAEIAALKEADAALGGEISNLEKVTGYTGAYESLPTSGAVGDLCFVNGVQYLCTAVENNIPTWEATSNESARIETLKARVEEIAGGSETDIGELTEAVENIEKTISELDNTYATDKELADGLAGVRGETTETVASVDAKAVANATAITNIKNGTTINDFAGVENAINKLGDTYATDQELSDGLAGVRGETTETVASVDAKAEANATAIENLDKKVTEELQAADAMKYIGTISAATDLPTAEVQKGNTYKATTDILKTDFSDAGITVNWATTGEQPKDEYYARTGDLFIATGEEDATTGYITTIVWDHVPAGYNAEYVPLMTATEGAEAVDIKLTSAHAATGETGDLGAFSIGGQNGVSVGLNNGKVSIGLVWGTF